MATLFDEVQDLALTVIRDPKIETLYKEDPNIFREYMDGFLIKAIPKFTECMQSLGYSLELREFNNDLNLEEKNILSDWLVIIWLDSEINDTRQFNLHLQDRDFKMHSEAQNLKSKSDYRNTMRETLKQDIVDYQIKYYDWSSLYN